MRPAQHGPIYSAHFEHSIPTGKELVTYHAGVVIRIAVSLRVGRDPAIIVTGVCGVTAANYSRLL